jgi:hypothetical protein
MEANSNTSWIPSLTSIYNWFYGIEESAPDTISEVIGGFTECPEKTPDIITDKSGSDSEYESDDIRCSEDAIDLDEHSTTIVPTATMITRPPNDCNLALRKALNEEIKNRVKVIHTKDRTTIFIYDDNNVSIPKCMGYVLKSDDTGKTYGQKLIILSKRDVMDS